MSRPLSDRQRAEVTAFVRALYERSGIPTQAEWARRAGYPATNLSNVMNGKQGIDGYNLMQLIRVTDIAPEELEQLLAASAAGGNGSAPAARLDDRVADAIDGLTKAIDRLQRVVVQLTNVTRVATAGQPADEGFVVHLERE